MTKAVFCLANNVDHANRIVDHLLSSGFSNEDISVLYPDQKYDQGTRKGKLATENTTKAPEGATTGATVGGIIGGSLGLLAGIGALAIPGVGPFIAAGPLMAALAGSGIGGSTGLIIGAIVGAGIPEYEAKKYEEGVRAGKILISAHTDNKAELDRVKKIMEQEGAKDISCSSEEVRNK
jgi:hypothetical protein